MTYNDFNSSQSNDASDFIAKVLNNLQMILDKVQESPEMLAIFTMAPNYANASVVTDVEHYGTNTTAGGDQVILYGGTVTTDENGVVHIDNKNDDPDYQATMNDLLRNLKERYSMLPSDVVEKIFREAQRQALATAQNNIEDCPNGTGKSAGSLRDSTKDWSGAESRSGDEFRIDMDQLVELTLYNFDKLLYSNMALTEDKMNLTNMSDIKIDWTEIENSSNKAQLNTIKDKSFADIMKDGTDLVPISGTWSTSIDEVKTIAKNRITELIEGISSALIKAGFNEDNVKKVAISVASYYKAAIDAVTDQVDRGDKGENKLTMSFKYKDVNGNEVQVTGAEYYQKEYKFTDSAKYGTTTSYNNSVNYTGLKLSESYKDTNHYILYLQVNEVLERFQDFYNAL